jgi:hypothetical protein
MAWYEILISVLTGLATAIPLVIQLVKYVEQSVKEKNWGNLVSLILKLIGEAEEKFDNGADKKQWVLSMIEASADSINYKVNIDDVSKLIDSLCDMSKIVNTSINKNVK